MPHFVCIFNWIPILQNVHSCKMCAENSSKNIRAAMPCHCHEDVPQDFDQVFPYRMIHDEEYVHLSDEPHAHDEERNLISY